MDLADTLRPGSSPYVDRTTSGSESEGVFGLDTISIQKNEQISPQRENLASSSKNDLVDQQSEPTSDAAAMASRAYQLEMFERSKRENVIVAMDTGSGKTQVAVLRIKAELENAESNKIIWFLAPTVILCGQQFNTIRLQMSAVPIKLLTGNDKLDTWNSAIWEAILDGVRVVVSTYQVLLDALSHAYIRMDQLALIVFDEAHNCVRKHPGSKIMSNFYHRERDANKPRPAILGLTATPSIRSVATDLEALEALLDARCISPTLHREELLKFVKRPLLKAFNYQISRSPPTSSMISLEGEYRALDIMEDPLIQSLQRNLTDRNKRHLERAILKNETFSMLQIKGAWSRSQTICQQLGSWAADYYIWKVVSEFLKKINGQKEFLNGWINEEKRYVAGVFHRIDAHQPPDRPMNTDHVSDKVNLLLRELLEANEPAMGIIFVKERAVTVALTALLCSFPQIRKRYRIGSMIGTSNFDGRSAVYDLVDEHDMQTLQNFRSGKINLLVATSVLEEGIDVPACNLIICFDMPDTPKSFIQRRGRARNRDSQLLLFLDNDDAQIESWADMEMRMIELYTEEERRRKDMEKLEDIEEAQTRILEIPSTGARLDHDNAKQHLEHFCRVLTQGEFVDSRPDYILEENNSYLKAKVLLPTFVPSELRVAHGISFWETEKSATKDAAFQAYLALYKAGLINDNLLPFKPNDILGVETRDSIVKVENLIEPWRDVAQEWEKFRERWLYTISWYENDQHMGDYDLILPIPTPHPRPINLYLDWDKTSRLEFSEGRRISVAECNSMPDHTSTLLAMNFGHRWHLGQEKQIIKISAKGQNLSINDIGSQKIDIEDSNLNLTDFLIRDNSNSPHIYLDLLPGKPPVNTVQHPFLGYTEAPENVPYLVMSKWTRRSDFLHPIACDASRNLKSTKQYSRVLPLQSARMDAIPIKHARFGMLIPSLIHELEVHLISQRLSGSLLVELGIPDLQVVREAISSRSANEPLDYERLEFLGDSILKFCASIQALADHPSWPEGYLSLYKDRLVSNSRLARAAMKYNLAQFILTKSFTGQKWRPVYLQDMLNPDASPKPVRSMATKTLADVIEALIGASYVTGGTAKALKCIHMLLGGLQWNDISIGRNIIYEDALENITLSYSLKQLEDLIGYRFLKKSLLVEAMTHASFVSTLSRSWERLEFLGDAILDKIIVSKLFKITPHLSNSLMHTAKTALVNKDFLAFIVLEEHDSGLMEKITTSELEIIKQPRMTALWRYMCHSSPAVGLELLATTERHKAMRGAILDALKYGSRYPWSLLAHLHARKFYCDLFEALLGAIWVDSGSLETCELIVKKFGILDHMDRLIRDQVRMKHPKEEIGGLTGSEEVKYKTELRQHVSGDREYTCALYVGERLLVEVGGGASKEDIETKAATLAVEIIEQQNIECKKQKRESGSSEGSTES